MNIGTLFKNLKFKTIKKLVGGEQISKSDAGILKVAFMIAALDGDVTEAEYKAFEILSKKCRGCTPKAAAAILKEAMYSAGYLMLLSKRTNTTALVRAFIDEAKAALPDGFAYCAIDDVRRAVVTWTAVAMCDGDYSPRERTCIKTLLKFFAELKIRRADADEDRAAALSPAFRMAYGNLRPEQLRTTLSDKSFASRVEKLMATYDDSAAATKEVQSFIGA